MNRRDMLKGLATLPLLAVSLKAAHGAPVIYGDGKHDDTDGLAAWFNGRPVRWADGREAGRILSGEFRATRTIEVDRRVPGGRVLAKSTLRYGGDVNAPILKFTERPRDIQMTDVTFIGPCHVALTGRLYDALA